MSIFDVLSLLCGLALFLYGMEVMGDALKKSAGSSLKTILGKMTSNPVKGFLLGLAVTAVIQSSSATTVMVVGFVNSGTMTLLQAVGVIMGANVGTAVTSWLTGLSGLGNGGATALSIIKWLKPDSWMPILAVIGICLIMFVKRGRKKDIGAIFLGFSVLMVGMGMMSDSVGGLAQNESFRNILIMFENPILGILAGTILTAIVQSSSASVGILQSLTVTGAITYGAAIPIVMGQNIGTCVTALISSISATRNGKRAALVHLFFNIIGVIVVLCLFYIVDSFVNKGDIVVLVTPIDEAAPKGRIILPQQNVLRNLLDIGAVSVVVQVEQLEETLKSLGKKPAAVITDSQVFGAVSKIVPAGIPLTSFSILFAKYKGILDEAVRAVSKIETLSDGDKILVAEGCSHHRQCNDIGTVKIPAWIKKHTGKDIKFEFTSGREFPDSLSEYALVLHCGGCMITERDVTNRMEKAIAQDIPFTNYGILIAYMNGILKRSIEVFPELNNMI